MQWLHLLRILGQLVDHKQYTDEELENFNWEDRCHVIQSNLVTCARHFDYQVNQFLTNFLLSSAEPSGTISAEGITSYTCANMASRSSTVSS